MKKKLFGDSIVAVDIGTTKICVLVSTLNAKGEIEILGIGQHPSFGLKKGVVVNINTTVDSIKKAVAEAEKMSGIKIDSACVGISGGHIKSFNSTGVVAIRGKEVTQSDIDRVIEAAKAVPIPKEQEILHVIPQYFRIDGQEYLTDSVGMHGVRLEAQIHMVTGSVSSARNIIKACELSGVRVTDVVLEQIASAQAVLTPAEREMGVGIIDIGGGTCDFAVYRNGKILHSKVLPVAGNHFTNDLAVGLGIPFNKAEELKRRYGAVCLSAAKKLSDAYIDIDLGYQGGIKTVSLESISEILNFRAEEIFDLFVDEILEFRLRNSMPLGFVLTGGGSLLQGIKQLAMNKLDTSVRVGIPEENATCLCNIPDLLKSPIYSTVYGLLLYSVQQKEQSQHYSGDDSTANRIFTRMRSWIYDFF